METLQPKLRFPEFKVNWDKSKIKDIVTRYTEPVKVELHTQYRQIGIRSHGKGLFHKNLVSGETLGSKRVFWIKENALIINIVFAWEQAVAKTTEKEVGMIASHRFPMYLPFNNKSNVDFLNYFFLTKKGKFLLESASPGGAGRNKTLGQKEFDNSKIIVPSIQEQTKISNFLSSVDEKLNLLKEKKALLEDYKKGIIQKIFNQELRFKDDSGNEFEDWEEKSLGEIGTFQTSSIDKLLKEDEEEVYLVNYMNVYRHENINNDTKKYLQIVTAKENQIITSNLKKGDILFTPSSETPEDIGHSVVIFEDLDKCVYSYHLMRFRPKIEIDILYSHYFCNNTKVLSQLSRLATGSTRFTISVKSFSSILIDLPCLKEQAKIANFLSAIDEKVDLIANQVQDTEEYKKSLLQQMFV